MVLAGQFLERPTIIVSAGCYLEGLWHRGDDAPALLICPPHPLRGACMDSPICAELAFAVSRRGHATLRFNYRGAGASQGALSADLDACVEDAQAALGVLRQNVEHGAVAVAGYDFGARVAVELAKRDPGLRGLALVSPTEPLACADLALPKLFAVGEHDSGCDRSALAQVAGEGIVTIPGADHIFRSGLSELGDEVGRFVVAL